MQLFIRALKPLLKYLTSRPTDRLVRSGHSVATGSTGPVEPHATRCTFISPDPIKPIRTLQWKSWNNNANQVITSDLGSEFQLFNEPLRLHSL